jgi:hypothetical protein
VRCAHKKNVVCPPYSASSFSILDVIEFEMESLCPSGYQSENIYFVSNSVKSIAKIKLSNDNLSKLTSNAHLLFGNRGKAVHCDVVDELTHSLLFIRAEAFQPYIKNENNQLRIKFWYKQNEYDLPVTDIEFDRNFHANPNILQGVSQLYLAISLAVEYNCWHTKLIAGVVYI